jgi:DNA-binding CsgD family transcriptional regulator
VPEKSLALTLAELRQLVQSRQRRARAAEAVPLLLRLMAACRQVTLEERSQGLAVRLAGETEQRAPFHITCILPARKAAHRLTAAEQAVAEMLCEGHTLAQIANLRGVSANTVKSQVRQVFRKLDVESRVALVRQWYF